MTQQLAIIQTTTKDHLGYAHMPLTDIPNDCFVVDILHKFLRVSDLLVDLLLDDLFRIDQFYVTTKFDARKHTNVNVLSEFLHDNCKRKRFEEGSDSKEIRVQMKSMMGPQKNIFFNQITSSKTNIKALFKSLAKRIEITILWSLYWFIHKILRAQRRMHFNFVIDYSSEFIKIKCTELLDSFLSIYLKEKVTPYLHVTCHHLHECHKKYGNMSYWSNEGLEKLNDLSTHDFFSLTNKKENFIKQMLEKDVRLSDPSF